MIAQILDATNNALLPFYMQAVRAPAQRLWDLRDAKWRAMDAAFCNGNPRLGCKLRAQVSKLEAAARAKHAAASRLIFHAKCVTVSTCCRLVAHYESLTRCHS